jgi:hypothetical protein
MLENRLRVNASVFHQDFSNYLYRGPSVYYVSLAQGNPADAAPSRPSPKIRGLSRLSRAPRAGNRTAPGEKAEDVRHPAGARSGSNVARQSGALIFAPTNPFAHVSN